MSIEVQLGTIGTGVFLLGLLYAVIGTLDLLRITNISQKLKVEPASMLVGAVPLFTIPILAGLGNAISPFWGGTLPFIFFMFFMISAAIMMRRARKPQSHNKSLNTDASDAGAG